MPEQAPFQFATAFAKFTIDRKDADAAVQAIAASLDRLVTTVEARLRAVSDAFSKAFQIDQPALKRQLDVIEGGLQGVADRAAKRQIPLIVVPQVQGGGAGGVRGPQGDLFRQVEGLPLFGVPGRSPFQPPAGFVPIPEPPGGFFRQPGAVTAARRQRGRIPVLAGEEGEGGPGDVSQLMQRRLVRGLAGDIASQLSPELGRLQSSFTGAIELGGRFGAKLGAAAAAVGLLSIAVATYVDSAQKAIQQQVQLDLALQFKSAEGAEAVVAGIAAKIAELGTNTKVATQEADNLAKRTEVIVAFWNKFFGPSAKQLAEDLRNAGEAADKLFFQVDVPLRVAKRVEEQAALAKTVADIQSKLALGAEGLGSAGRAQEAALRGQLQARLDVIDQSVAKEIDAIPRILFHKRQQAQKDADFRKTQLQALADLEIAEVRRTVAEQQRIRQDQLAAQTRAAARTVVETLGASRLPEVKVFEARRASLEADTKAEIAAARVVAEERAKVLDVQERLAKTKPEKAAVKFARLDLELDLARQIEGIETTAAGKKVQLAEQTRERILAISATQFEMLRALGLRSADDAVDVQKQIVDAYEKGSAKRLDAERTLLDKIRAARAEELGGGQTVLEQGIAQLRQEGYTGPINRELAEAAFERRRTGAKETAQRFARGEVVGQESDIFGPGIQQALQFQSVAERVAATGRTPGALLRGAAEQVGTTLGEAPGAAGLGLGALASTANLERFTGAYKESFAAITTAADEFIRGLKAKFDAGNDALAQSVYTRLRKRLIDELTTDLGRG